MNKWTMTLLLIGVGLFFLSAIAWVIDDRVDSKWWFQITAGTGAVIVFAVCIGTALSMLAQELMK
jgi:uncharacterized membrane protein